MGGRWKRGPATDYLAGGLPQQLKAAFSDALKRAAIKLGIGRYLYRLPSIRVDYDPQKRQFVKPPVLPAWALPAAKQSA